MNAVKEIERRDKKISDDKKRIAELTEEIEGLRQLLDCAAANICLLVAEKGGTRKISRSDVRQALGKYHLCAKSDDEGNYLLELVEEGNA